MTTPAQAPANTQGSTADPSPDTVTTSPTAPPLPDPSAAPAPAPGNGEEDKLVFSKDAFQERLKREQRIARERWLKEQGFADEAAFASFKDAAARAAEEAEEKRKAEMSENERLKAEIAERDAKIIEHEQARKAAEEAAEAAKAEAHLHGLYAERGIKKTRYADFLIEDKLNSIPDGEDFDEKAFLDELLKDPAERIALGIDAASGETSPPTPASTVTTDNGPNPKPPHPKANKPIAEMTEEEYRAYKKGHLGID